MHNSRKLTTIFRKLTLVIIIFSLSAVLTNCAAIAGDNTSKRVSSISSDAHNPISIYAVEAANNIDISFTKTVKGWFIDAGGWLMGIIISLLCIGALFLLGNTGLYLRRGIKIKKSLNKARSDALLKGHLLNKNYYKFKKKSTLYIVLPVLLWMTAYGILFMILPLEQFYVSLFALIAPILGFFGVFFVPSEDLSDYF